MRKAIFALFSVICTFTSVTYRAEADGVKPARLVVDAETGQVLVADRADTPWYPASLTKLMTAYLVFSEIAAGRLTMDVQIVVSAAAAAEPPTKFGLKAGQKITIHQAVNAMIVTSANDAAVALAEAVAGSESAFVQRMNAAALQLDMIDTRFRNATGLPDDAQVTTARDIAVLARTIIHDFPDRYPLFAQRQATIAGRTLPTVNGFLGFYSGAEGMKTGFTCGSGYNIVGAAKHGDERLIGVVLGASSLGDRAARIHKLLDSGFKGGETVPVSMSNIAMVPASLTMAIPPTVLKGSDCASTDSTDEGEANARLSGWGIIFGAYSSPGQAKTAINGVKARLKPVMGAGRPAVVERQIEGTRRYAALLVGLQPKDAGKACKALWQESQYCLALNPTVLNDPTALWR
ncbi:MAG TPA: D-alanyl-D-alanine carboxypeptidase family protein [Dongiaceae bacterium]|jgi:D-alanyl-D-alanine carboxypeptidase